ncbi:MAG TPA: peptidase S9, partial [bacterium]|nr:peptidase S9 [bacterium]
MRTITIGQHTVFRRVLGAALLLLATALPAELGAQDFGRNKVAYKVIDFSVLSTEHFRIFHYPRGAPPVVDAARLLERWYAQHAALLGFGLTQPQKVILYDSFSDFQQTYAVPGLISAGEGGVTESSGNRIILALTGVPADDTHVLGHELVHAFQFQELRSAGLGPNGGPSLPTWLVEGMAEYLSLGPDDPLTAMWMRDA